MSEHVEQFSIFVAALLEKLYDSFPISIDLTTKEFVESPDITRWFEELDKAVESIPREEHSFARAEAAAKEAKKISQRYDDYKRREKVFKGTIEFLITEAYIRCDELFSDEGLYRGCQLTAKGFSHLHKEFKDKALRDEESSIIKWIKNRFTTASSIEGAVIVSVISRFFG